MGVYIKGMEMPKNGETITITICDDGVVFEELREPGSVFKAIPVPPHGRLIDADAEIARVQNLYNKAVAKDPEMGCVSVYEGEIAALKLAPTVIPAEEGE